MSLLNLTVAPGGVWLSADSAFGPAPAGMTGPQVSGDAETVRAGTFATVPAAQPVIGGYGQKVAILGTHLVIGGTGYLRPMKELATAIERGGWDLDEAVARAPVELCRIAAEAPQEAAGAVVLAGWSKSADRALAFALASGDGLAARRLDDGHLTSPLPDATDPAYRQLYALYSLPAGELVEELHAALALNQAAAARRGAYQVALAIGGEVLMLRVARDGTAF